MKTFYHSQIGSHLVFPDPGPAWTLIFLRSAATIERWTELRLCKYGSSSASMLIPMDSLEYGKLLLLRIEAVNPVFKSTLVRGWIAL